MSTKSKTSTYRHIKDNVLNQISAILLLIIITAYACSKAETPQVVRIENYIEDEMQPHFDSFKAEAALRNVEIDFEALRISAFLKVINGGVAGQCKTYSDETKEIEIDPRYWNNASDVDKEFIIYHELGHCALNREHINIEDDHGNCLSIMNGGGEFCFNNYNPENREEMLDELFDIN